jgi:ABC-type polysaccharide/polyol phosphate export permease
MMPAWLARVAMFNPLSYGINPIRALFLKGPEWPSLASAGRRGAGVTIAATALASGMSRRSIT